MKLLFHSLASFSMHKNNMFSSDSLAFVERCPRVVGLSDGTMVLELAALLSFFRMSIVTTSEGSSLY